MTRMQKFALASVAAVCVALNAGAAFAQSAKDLVGTWQLMSNVIDQGGKKIDQFGRKSAWRFVLRKQRPLRTVDRARRLTEICEQRPDEWIGR